MNANDLYRDKTVLVTGSEGFLGRHVCDALVGRGANVIRLVHSSDPRDGGNLIDIVHATTIIENCVTHGRLDYVFHLAGYNGGIEFNRQFPADIFYANTTMGLNLLFACSGRKDHIGKVVSIVASCAYPDNFFDQGTCETGVYREQTMFSGQPNDSVACHGYAKRNLQLCSKYCYQQYGLNAVCLCPTTLYGPGDSFHPMRTKVVGAMIKRIVDAKKGNAPQVSIWGDGTPLRELMYVKDAAELICEAGAKYEDSSIPLNIGSGQEISVLQLAQLVAQVADYKGAICLDKSKPTGQMRKRLRLDKMLELLPDWSEANLTSLKDGIAKTILCYEAQP